MKREAQRVTYLTDGGGEQVAEGKILKGIGGFYYVEPTGGGELIECRARGRFRKDGIKPQVGDQVLAAISPDGTGYLEEILPRRNSIIRPAIANVDRAFVVVTPKDPEPNLLLIDKILAICESKQIDPVVVINKTDLDSGAEIEQIYRNAGFVCIKSSAKDGIGIEQIRSLMQGKVCFFCGSSGIGKSSIINLLDASIQMEVGAISAKIQRGRHTTRHVELFPVSGGGYIADTPGFSSFDLERLDHLQKDELIYDFRDLERYADGCQFTGCSHTCEKGCRVLQALREGKIAESRHQSYVTLYDELKKVKDWER